MLWPFVLPIKIAFWFLTGCVFVVTALSPLFKRRVEKVFLVSCCVAMLLFVPLCGGISSYVNAGRFGVFNYEKYDEVDDGRVERYLPRAARKIVLDKQVQGHRAMYEIDIDELRGFLDELWAESKGRSAISREEIDDGKEVSSSWFELRFDGLDWKLPQSAIRFHSPVESDGGGAEYYFDQSTGKAFHHAGYW